LDILEKMSVEIFEIESPEYERSFYMVNDNSTYMSPVAEAFRNFVIENSSVLKAL
jgi:DNA-binding transcriptional LysR family regulator